MLAHIVITIGLTIGPGVRSGTAAQTAAPQAPTSSAAGAAARLTDASQTKVCAQTDPITAETLVPAMREAWALVNAEEPGALPCYERIVPAAERFGDDRQKAYANDGYAWALSQAERRTEARRAYTRALELYRAIGDEPNAARALRNLGANHYHAKEMDDARSLLRRAAAIFERLDLPKDLAITIEHLAYAMDEGDPEKAALRARGLAAARRGKHEPAACGIQHEWGDGLFQQGRYSDAVAHLSEALACFERVRDTPQIGRVLVSLGRVQRAHGQLSSALAYYQRALTLQEQRGDRLGAVQSLNAIAVTYTYLDRTDEALAQYEQALAMAKAIPSPENVAFLTGQIGGLRLQRRELALSIPMLEEAIRSDPSQDHLPYRLGQVSVAYALTGRLAEAAAAADRAVTMARAVGPEPLLPALAVRSQVRQLAGRLTEAQADLTEATALVEAVRANTIATDFMKRGFGQQHQQLYGAAIELQIRRGQPLDALQVAEQARARAFLDLLASRVKPSAGSGSPGHVRDERAEGEPRALGSEVSVAAPTLDDVRATARRLRSTLLVYWVGDTATQIWVVSPTGRIHASRVDITRSQLTHLVSAATQSTQAAAAGLATFGVATRPWRALYETVIAPVRAYLPSAPDSLLTIVPHGPLFQVSFAALQDERGRYLLEHYRLHYTPSVGVLSFTAARARDDSAAPAGGALLVGDPLPLTPLPGEDAMPPLPFARREVDEIGRLLAAPRPTILTEQAAREANVRARIEQASLLHFATHGVVRQEESLASYLALSDGAPSDTALAASAAADSVPADAAPADAASTARAPVDAAAGADSARSNGEASAGSNRADDGRLTADEVYGLRLAARLVVLSACRTALGPLTGDGVIGFTRAFLYAGASSVIATSWDVPDASGYEVMRRFYEARARRRAGPDESRIASAGMGTADALRAAQLSMLSALRRGTFTVDAPAGRIAPREHPLFWAGFLLVGEP